MDSSIDILELEDELDRKHTTEQRAFLIKLYVSRLMKSKNQKSIKDIKPHAEVDIPASDKTNMNPAISRIGDILYMDMPRNDGHEVLFRRGCNMLLISLSNQ